MVNEWGVMYQHTSRPDRIIIVAGILEVFE
jgi:hypothetical protein